MKVFAGPADPGAGDFRGHADWCRRSASPEAHAARDVLNSWYASFPDKANMVLSRIGGSDETNFLQAVDELHIHELFSRSCKVRYEENARSPDFRLYRGTEYMAGVEVCTLFSDKDFDAEIVRNSRLMDELNRRVAPTNWFVAIGTVTWIRQPRVTAIAKWLESTIAALPAPPAALSHTEYPTAVYSSPEVELGFRFLPRRLAPTADKLVLLGPASAWFPGHEDRLREALSKKGGSRYDHRDKPFAIFVSLRTSCDVKDLVNALYGDDAIAFEREDHGSARPHRRRNGFFTRNAKNPEGRNQRVSCVFALMPGWTPGTPVRSEVVRFDNPFATRTFPDDLVVPDARFVAQHDESAVRMAWA